MCFHALLVGAALCGAPPHDIGNERGAQATIDGTGSLINFKDGTKASPLAITNVRTVR